MRFNHRRVFDELFNFIFLQHFFSRMIPQSLPTNLLCRIVYVYRSCTYYDQLVICGWCCESFIQMVQDFVDGHSCVLPTAEGLDIVLEMCELAQNIAGIMEFAEEVNCLSFIFICICFCIEVFTIFQLFGFSFQCLSL